MKIYVFDRPDGSVWADFSYELAKRHKIRGSIECNTRAEMEAVMKAPGELAPARVRGLAERAYREFLAANQQPTMGHRAGRLGGR